MSPFPITGEDQTLNAPEQYNRLTPEEKYALQLWIYLAVAPAIRSEGRTSYGIKHDFEDVGFYVTNGAFKGALLDAGYKPTASSADDINWEFRVRPRHRRRGGKSRKDVKTLGRGFPVDDPDSFYGLWHATKEELADLRDNLTTAGHPPRW